MLIVAIDPGGTTGFCVVDTKRKTVESQQIRDPVDVAYALQDVVEANTEDAYALRAATPDKMPATKLVVVVEDFVGAGRRDTNIVGAIKILGYIELFCQAGGIELVTQAPHKRLAYLVEAAHRYPEHKCRHCKDAYAHALSYLVRIRGGDLGDNRHIDSAEVIDRELQGGPCDTAAA